MFLKHVNIFIKDVLVWRRKENVIIIFKSKGCIEMPFVDPNVHIFDLIFYFQPINTIDVVNRS